MGCCCHRFFAWLPFSEGLVSDGESFNWNIWFIWTIDILDLVLQGIFAWFFKLWHLKSFKKDPKKIHYQLNAAFHKASCKKYSTLLSLISVFWLKLTPSLLRKNYWHTLKRGHVKKRNFYFCTFHTRQNWMLMISSSQITPSSIEIECNMWWKKFWNVFGTTKNFMILQIADKSRNSYLTP